MEWVPFSEVLKFVRFDTHCNDIFVLGGTVMRQVRGMARPTYSPPSFGRTSK